MERERSKQQHSQDMGNPQHDGGSTQGIDQGNVLASEAELLNTHAQGYFGAFEAGVQTVMVGFFSYKDQGKDAGNKHLAFVIGGPDGLGALPRIKPGRSLAFGPQTWPHLLVRAMLAEQVYRGLSILAGHPYHRA